MVDEDGRMEEEAAEVPGPVLGPSMASRPLAECLVGVNRVAASAGGGLAALFADGGWDRCTEEKIN